MSLKSFEKTGTNEVTLELSISAEVFADANNKAYNKVKKNIAVPGFRKGKAPKAFIEKYYGEGVFYDDALEIAFPDAYEAAVAEAGIDPVDNPFDFDIKSVGKDGVELSCKVTVKPEIELGEYKGLKAEKEAVAVRCSNEADFLNQMKLIELFACKAENIQIFFTDFFQMNQTYNTPGTSGDKNWSLRLPENFADMQPINLPLLLKKAIIARGSEFANANKELIGELDAIQ